MICSEMLLETLKGGGAGGGAAVAGEGSWALLSVGTGGAVRSTKLLGPFVVGGCGGSVVGVDVVCLITGGALMVPGLGSQGRVESW